MKEIKKKLKNLLNKEEEILIATYDGGNDSGEVSIENEVSDILSKEESEKLLSRIEDILEYGSWAWDGSANGEVFFTKKGEIRVEGTESVEEYIPVNKLEKL